MKKITCIICPNGCEITIDDEKNIIGNKCPKGKDFALQEITNPMRSISTTVKTIFKEVPVVPCKVNKEIPKEKIHDVIGEINKLTIDKKLGINEIIIKNVSNTNADVVITSNILKEEK